MWLMMWLAHELLVLIRAGNRLKDSAMYIGEIQPDVLFSLLCIVLYSWPSKMVSQDFVIHMILGFTPNVYKINFVFHSKHYVSFFALVYSFKPEYTISDYEAFLYIFGGIHNFLSFGILVTFLISNNPTFPPYTWIKKQL